MAAREKERLLEMHQPHWNTAFIWLCFLAAFGVLEGCLAWALVKEAPVWALAILVLLLAHLMHAHLIAFHEAAHAALFPIGWMNDVAGIFIGILSFMSFALYRAVHHYHHAYLATERDEELWPFVLPGSSWGVRCLCAALELLLGLVYTPLLFLRSFLRKESPLQGHVLRRRIVAEFLLIAVVWAVILAATAWWQAWSYLLILYLLPALLAGNSQSLRKYIEHMGLRGSTVRSSTRSVLSPGPVGRLLAFTLFNEPYHGVHHHYAKLPQAALPEFASILTPVTSEELPPYPNYRTAFLAMVRSLADPCIGSQWREGKQHER